MRTEESRRYRILGVLGEGGFGKVYKARLEGPQGFLKDVAIKLLSDAEAPEAALRRFRDESRILGLIRDRAIVNVDPPTRLQGRWAVVMEYVEGQSVLALRRRFEVIPPRVCLGIVGEVARALDKVYRTPGPDGQPLELLHRDIKPANLQITPSGEVKILDFGIARASFDNREAVTTNHIGGTVGYIAPERLEGEEGPKGDVYSLGIVLKTMLTGLGPKRLKQDDPPTFDDPEIRMAWELADQMTRLEPDQRPSARAVEDRCAELVGRMDGPTLRRWAEKSVLLESEGVSGDELVGHVLTETMATVRVGVEDTQGLITDGPSRSRSVMVAATVGTVGSVVAVGALLLVGLGAWLLARGLPWEAEVAEPVAVVAPDPTPAPTDLAAPPPAPTDLPAPEPTEAPAPLPSEPTPAPSPAPPRPTPTPPPAPAAAPAAAPVAATFPVVVTSSPLGADVYLDGARIGATPLFDHPMTAGSHTLRLALDGAEVTQAITVGKRAPVRYFWKVGEAVQASY